MNRLSSKWNESWRFESNARISAAKARLSSSGLDPNTRCRNETIITGVIRTTRPSSGGCKIKKKKFKNSTNNK